MVEGFSVALLLVFPLYSRKKKINLTEKKLCPANKIANGLKCVHD